MFKLHYFFCSIFSGGFVFRFINSKYMSFKIKVQKNIFLKACDRSIVRIFMKLFILKCFIFIDFFILVLVVDCYVNIFLFL